MAKCEISPDATEDANYLFRLYAVNSGRIKTS